MGEGGEAYVAHKFTDNFKKHVEGGVNVGDQVTIESIGKHTWGMVWIKTADSASAKGKRVLVPESTLEAANPLLGRKVYLPENCKIHFDAKRGWENVNDHDSCEIIQIKEENFAVAVSYSSYSSGHKQPYEKVGWVKRSAIYTPQPGASKRPLRRRLASSKPESVA